MKHHISLSTIILFIIVCAGCSTFPGIPPTPTLATISTLAPTRVRTAQPTATTHPIFLSSIYVSNPTDRMVLRVDANSGEITASYPITGRPDIIATGEGAVWALDKEVDRLYRIDPETGKLTATIALPSGDAEALAVGNGMVWVGMTGRIDLSAQLPGIEEDVLPPGMVAQIDPRSNTVIAQFPAQPVNRLVVNGSALWVLSHDVIDTPLQVFDLSSNQGMAVPIRNGPEWLLTDAIAIGKNAVWLFSASYGRVYRASLDGIINSAIEVGSQQPTGYADMLLDETGLWAITPWGTVLHIDSATNKILGKIELNAPLTELLDSPGAVWVHSQQVATLFRIDPASNQVTNTIPTGSFILPTVIPSPTPRVVLWQPCPDAPTSRLKVGDLAYVTKESGLPNRVRKEPNREAEILGYITPGGSMELLEGPTCADGWVWWRVKNANITGWTAEGDKEGYWLIPLFK